MNTSTVQPMSKAIIRFTESHFQEKLSLRYGIQGEKKDLQKAFKKRLTGKNIQKYNTRMVKNYNHPVRDTKAFITRFQGQEVLFVWDTSLSIAKTALTYREYK